MQTVAIVEKVLAGAIVLVCLGLLVRQFAGLRWRYRIDALFFRLARSMRRLWWRFYRWPVARRVARREADAAIRRAQTASATTEGNVQRPKSSGKSRKLH
jgi:hypothetical protein